MKCCGDFRMNVLDIVVNETGLKLVVIQNMLDLMVSQIVLDLVVHEKALDLMMIVLNCIITLNL